jgi:hypothetical protein
VEKGGGLTANFACMLVAKGGHTTLPVSIACPLGPSGAMRLVCYCFCRFVLPSIRFVTAPTCPGTQSPTPSNIGHDKYQCGTERGMLAQSRDLGTLMHRKPNPSQTLACHTVGIPDTARVRDLMISLSKPSCSHSRLMCFERVAMHALHTCAQGVDTLQHL